MRQPAIPLPDFQTSLGNSIWPHDRSAWAKPKTDSEDPGVDEAENVEGDEREERTWRDATVTQRCQPCHGAKYGKCRVA
jgi:hypothetical protein